MNAAVTYTTVVKIAQTQLDLTIAAVTVAMILPLMDALVMVNCRNTTLITMLIIC